MSLREVIQTYGPHGFRTEVDSFPLSEDPPVVLETWSPGGGNDLISMSPTEARYLAAHLIAAADYVDAHPPELPE
jgi:hypothetical protein